MAFLYALISVLIVSIISLIGIVTLGLRLSLLKRIVLRLVSFSAGALLGDVFFHLLPGIIHGSGRNITVSLRILGGIVFGLVTEKVIRRNHCHMPVTAHHTHPVALMNLIGDSVHNLIDGLIIGASYLVSIPVGIATTLAVVLHEIPQEIGDFGVLVHGGFSRRKALLLNFVTALTAVVGVIIAFLLYRYTNNMVAVLIPFAAGTFIYIACSDLIPELHKENSLAHNIPQILFFLLGIGIMSTLLFLE
ncbi:MAG: ZIP family metal transporter [candidate division SR1 bacterium]|nr:ZIP family metal transporter [candidate division SR1 bacterium]